MTEPAGPAAGSAAADRRPLTLAVAAADAGLGGLTGGFLRLEDAALLAWLLIGVPLGRSLAGAGSGGVQPRPGSDPIGGLLVLGAVALAIVVVATRSPGDPALGFDDIATPRSYAPLPFLLSLSIVSDTALERLGLETGALVGVIFLVTMGSYVLWNHLPNLPRTVRRLMILPFIFVAGTVFAGMVTDLSGLFDYRALLGDPSATPGAFAGLLALDVLFSGFFYLAFVFAPRMVAEAEGSWLAWLVRYAVFVGATIVSVTFVGAGG